MRNANRALTMVTALVLMLAAAPAARAHDWNDAAIAWKGYDEGLAQAKKDKKPICLVFFTEWCPHCKNFSGVFHDDKVVETSKKFVMIKLDKDKNAEISKKYSPDGEYIPRTFFLSPDGKLAEDVHAPRDQYKYFYNERDPQSVLGGMELALQKLK